MRRRPIMKFHPALEPFEAKQLLSASPVTTHAAAITATHRPRPTRRPSRSNSSPMRSSGSASPTRSHLVPYMLIPPFQTVLVQTNQPVPGQVYNVLQVAVRNGTSQTFTASNNFTVRLNTETGTFFRFSPE